MCIPQIDTAKFTDAYFSKDKASSRKGKEGEFFKDGAEKKEFPADKAADQKNVDKQILAAVKQTPNVRRLILSMAVSPEPASLVFWDITDSFCTTARQVPQQQLWPEQGSARPPPQVLSGTLVRLVGRDGWRAVPRGCGRSL